MTDKELQNLQDLIFNDLIKIFQEKGVSVLIQKMLMEGIYSRFLTNAFTYNSLSNNLNNLLGSDQKESSEK